MAPSLSTLNSPLSTALVTGGAVRLGRALVEALAGEGLRVIVHYHRSAAAAEEVVAGLRARGGEAVARAADLARLDEVERLAAEAEAVWGGVDVLVNSASVFPPQGLLETDAALWEQTLAVNLRAPVFLTRLLAPGMKRRGHGVVINLADLAGLQAWRFASTPSRPAPCCRRMTSRPPTWSACARASRSAAPARRPTWWRRCATCSAPSS